MRLTILTISFCLLFSACSQKNYDNPEAPTLQATDYMPMSINARKLTIIQNWNMPGEKPFYEHLISPNPSSVLNEWASNTLIPAGSSGDVTIDIRKASIVVTDIYQADSISEQFTDNQQSKIEVEMLGQIMWMQPITGQTGFMDARSISSKTVPESTTALEFDIAVQETILSSLEGFDRKLRSEIKSLNGMLLH
jgi:hypothetical protein